MTIYLLSPLWNGMQFFDANGNPLNGGLIETYSAGSFTNQQATYTDISGNTPNSNPIVLDSSGRITTEMWLPQDYIYNFVLLDSDRNVLTSCDNVQAPVNNPSGLPPQPGNAGYFLSTDGTTTSWQPVVAGPASPFLVNLTGTFTEYFTGGTANDYSAQVFNTSPDVHFDFSGNPPLITLIKPGTWKITVTPTMTTSGPWPNAATQYGTYLTGALGSGKSYHFRTATGSSTTNSWNFLNTNNLAQWTDVYFYTSTSGLALDLGIFAEMYSGAETGYTFTMFVECEWLAPLSD